VKYEPSSFADRVGLPYCSVSIPLSPSEVIENSKRSGNPNPESNGEWIRMEENRQPGDKLREVNCSGTTKRYGKFRDPYYYGLFRGDAIILKFHPVILD
jgi:hypothetical protein